VGGKATVIFARSADVDTHVGNLLRDALKAFGGGGGGRPEFAQGGGVAMEQLPALLEYAVERLEAD
jgi:alanyl-tRNA synthetase